MSARILVGDVLDALRLIPANSVDCVVTSPPYWGLRDYGVPGQIGLEPTLGQHIDVLVRVFREVRRVLKDHGTVWLNYGDCYAAVPNGKSAAAYKADGTDDRTFRDKPFSTVGAVYQQDHRPSGQQGRRGVSGNLGNGGINGRDIPQGRIVGFYDRDFATARGKFTGSQLNDGGRGTRRVDHGGRIVAGGYLKPKDLCMIPNRLAIALQDDGWWVRSEIIWHKPNPMPESVYDRPTTAHEKVFLLTKSEDYFYNDLGLREPVSPNTHRRVRQNVAAQAGSRRANGGSRADRPMKAVIPTGPNSRINVDRVPRTRKGDTGVGWGRLDRLSPVVHTEGRDRIKRPAGWDTSTGEGRHGTIHRKPGVSPKSAPDRRGIRANESWHATTTGDVETRNARNVWKIGSKPFRDAHFATFPPELARRCIVGGTPAYTCGLCGRVEPCKGGLCRSMPFAPGHVLDPFGGAGTVALVARGLGLDATIVELNPEYAEIAERRLLGVPAVGPFRRSGLCVDVPAPPAPKLEAAE